MLKNVLLFVVLVLCLCLSVTFAFAYTAGQADSGARLFAKNCSACHGISPHGVQPPQKFKTTPPVAGKGALPHFQGATAQDVYTYMKSNMPQEKPGSLSSTNYMDITAYLLKINGIESPGDKPLTEQTLHTVKIPSGN